MSQSLAKVYVHIIFSIRSGSPVIKGAVKYELHSFIKGVLLKFGSDLNEISSNPDHIHILCTLPRTISISELISKIKVPSSKLLKNIGLKDFCWQDGYGVFSVSSSKVLIVEQFIRNQPELHRSQSFKDELRIFFKEYGVEYNEQYVWD